MTSAESIEAPEFVHAEDVEIVPAKSADELGEEIDTLLDKFFEMKAAL